MATRNESRYIAARPCHHSLSRRAARANAFPGGSTISVGGQNPTRIDDLNPNEIEDIVIIKGPAAAALYGTAAANGVVQITTKRGLSGRTRWTAYADAGSLKEDTDFPANYQRIGTNS